MKNISIKNLVLNFSIFGAALLFVYSCVPVKPAVETNKKLITVDYLAKGQTIFENSCGKCHDLPNPSDHSAQDWVGIMNSMAPKARLTDAQHEMVYDYIVTSIK